MRSLLNGEPAVGIQIIQSPGANALDVSSAVRAAMDRLQAKFPDGIEYRIAYDPTVFVRASLQSVAVTLLEAIFLVVIVVVLFLQSWRASIIPLIAVPVSLVGTFAVMHMFGFSLNTLSLFGLVLSIGIVVDDAIVVVENVERHIALGESPKDAARKAMDEVTGPILAITSVLAAVFIPGVPVGAAGRVLSPVRANHRVLDHPVGDQLAYAVASAGRHPAQAAPRRGQARSRHAHHRRRVRRLLPPLQPLLRPRLEFLRRGVRRAVRGSAIVLLLYVGFLGLTWLGFHKVPAGFVPAQDKYYLVGIAQLPTGASLDRTEAVVKEMTKIALAEPGVESVVAFRACRSMDR